MPLNLHLNIKKMLTPSGLMPFNDFPGRDPNTSLKSHDLQCVQRVHGIISSNPTQHISIEGLAIETGTNRTKLQSGFKQLYGVTINDFQIHLRLEKAKELLLNTEKLVKEIAALSGYCSSSRLGVAFKEKYGLTPVQFRKQATHSSARYANGME